MAKRTDAHSPGNLDTEDYDFLGVIDYDWKGETYGRAHAQRVALVNAVVVDAGRRFASIHEMARCDHCGAFLRYAALMLHRPTDTVIEVGETCLDNRFELASADFHKARLAGTLDRKRQATKAAVADFVDANPDLAWLATDDVPEASQGNPFVEDIARKLRSSGELSERQVDALRQAVQRDAAQAAERAAEVWVPIPDDVTGRRATVTGTVLATKVQDSPYGSTRKMLLKVPHGAGAWKLWTTVPRQAGDINRGDTITLKVTVATSDDDQTFGYGSRPTLAQ